MIQTETCCDSLVYIARNISTKLLLFETLERPFDLPSETDYLNNNWINLKSFKHVLGIRSMDTKLAQMNMLWLEVNQFVR